MTSKAKFDFKERPHFVLIMGGVCSGKTTYRKQKYINGYTIIDASDIFIELSDGKYYKFPSHLENEMDKIGLDKCRNALSIIKRENIVTEIIGDDGKSTQKIIDLMIKIGYEIKIEFIQCSVDEALKRNASRSNDNISAYYCEPYHIKWISQAALECYN